MATSVTVVAGLVPAMTAECTTVILNAVWYYIARDNPERAVSFVTELRRHCRTLVAFPEAHALRADLGTGVRMAVHGKYLILYLVRDNVLEIRRVVHGARNLP